MQSTVAKLAIEHTKMMQALKELSDRLQRDFELRVKQDQRHCEQANVSEGKAAGGRTDWRESECDPCRGESSQEAGGLQGDQGRQVEMIPSVEEPECNHVQHEQEDHEGGHAKEKMRIQRAAAQPHHKPLSSLQRDIGSTETVEVNAELHTPIQSSFADVPELLVGNNVKITTIIGDYRSHTVPNIVNNNTNSCNTTTSTIVNSYNDISIRQYGTRSKSHSKKMVL